MIKDRDNSESSPAHDLQGRIQEDAHKLARRLPFVGHVTWLCARSDSHRLLFVQDLEWRVFPPILLEQCKLYFDNKAGNLPVAFASWAQFSESAERDYLAHQRIAPSNWNSGDRLWLIDFITPFGGSRSIFADIYESVLKGRDVNLLYPGAGGTPTQIKLGDLLEPAKASDDTSKDPVHH